MTIYDRFPTFWEMPGRASKDPGAFLGTPQSVLGGGQGLPKGFIRVPCARPRHAPWLPPGCLGDS